MSKTVLSALVDDVVALEARRAGAHVQRVRLRGAEVPALAGRRSVRAVAVEERPAVLRFARGLVVAEQRRPAAALAAIEAQKNQHRVAAGVVVDVAPVGVADREDAVAAAAIARVGQPDALRVVRRGKRESAARGEKRLNRGRGEARSGATRRRGIDESARLRVRAARDEHESDSDDRLSPAMGSQGHDEASKPSGRRISTRRWPPKFTWS